MATEARWKVTQAPNLLERVKLKDIMRELITQLGTSGKKWWLMHVEISQEAPDAIAVIEEGYTNILDSADTTTLHVESSSADDDVGGVGCEYVHLVYIDTDGDIQDLKQAMDGTSHSHINQGTWARLVGMYVDLTETVVPVGAITMKNHAEAEVYCTIAAGDTHSLTTKCWIPDGWQGACVSLVPKFEIANGANPVFANGTNIGLDVNGTIKNIQGIPPEQNGQDIINPQPYMLPLDGEAYLGVAHETIDTDANLTETIDVMYLMWEV